MERESVRITVLCNQHLARLGLIPRLLSQSAISQDL
jgi:hypothetical protein